MLQANQYHALPATSTVIGERQSYQQSAAASMQWRVLLAALACVAASCLVGILSAEPGKVWTLSWTSHSCLVSLVC